MSLDPKTKARLKRHSRIRKKIYGTKEKPRLCIFRSNKHIYSQIVDDSQAKTMLYVSSLDGELKKNIKTGSNKEAAAEVGKLLAKKAIKNKISEVVFDRGGYLYHGRVKALAEEARKGGLKF